jgi:histone deacetylase complex regulatory component SIN3
MDQMRSEQFELLKTIKEMKDEADIQEMRMAQVRAKLNSSLSSLSRAVCPAESRDSLQIEHAQTINTISCISQLHDRLRNAEELVDDKSAECVALKVEFVA